MASFSRSIAPFCLETKTMTTTEIQKTWQRSFPACYGVGRVVLRPLHRWGQDAV
jgi:hypothetical protein